MSLIKVNEVQNLAGEPVLGGGGKTSGVTIATTSGTEHDFTSLPSTVERVIITLSGVSLDGTDELLIQLGDSGGIVTSGYDALLLYGGGTTLGGKGVDFTTGFPIRSGSAGNTIEATSTLTKMEDHLWLYQTMGYYTSLFAGFGAGSLSLSNALETVRLTRSGSDNFDAGKFNIMYE